MEDLQNKAEHGLTCCCLSNHSPSRQSKSPDLQPLLLLSCMHRICVHCADAATSGGHTTAADSPSPKVSDSLSSQIILCELCGEPTNANERLRDVLAEQRLQAVHFAEHQPPPLQLDANGRAKPPQCQFCDGSSASTGTAILWCPDCQKSLCRACEAHHRRFLPAHGELLSPLAESINGDASASLVEQRRAGGGKPLACPRHFVNAVAATEPRGEPAKMAALVAADHACADCRTLCCATCAATCADAGHSVRAAAALGDRYVADVRRRFVDLARELQAGGEAAARAGEGLLPALGRSRAAAVRVLLANKRRLLELLDDAFDDVKAKVEDAHAALAERASNDLVPKSRRLAAAAERAAAYSRGILGEGEVRDNGIDERQLPLLLQHGLLLSRLEHLADRLRRFDVPHADAAGCLAAFDVESDSPGEQARHALTSWLGAPVLRPDIAGRELWSSVCRSALYGGVEGNDAARGQGDASSIGGASGLRGQLSPPTNCFAVPFVCRDIALNDAGDRVFVAAGAQGLFEYNLDGGELSRWEIATPPAASQRASVGLADPATAGYLVLPSNRFGDFDLDLDLLLQSSDDSEQRGVVGIGGVLSDGSAVVCIDGSSCVVLTRRCSSSGGCSSDNGRSSSGSWFEARRLAAFEGTRIFSLSVNGALVAAAEGCAPWPVARVPAARGGEIAFRVASVYSGSLQTRQTVESEISHVHSVAVVPDIVVVSGVDAKPRCGVVSQGDGATVVAGFRMATSGDASVSATCLWRVDRRYQDVRDMRAAYRGEAVYLLATTVAAGATPTVIAVDGRFGDCLAEMTLPDLLRSSYRLSAALATSNDGRKLALLHFNEKRIFAIRAPDVRPPRW